MNEIKIKIALILVMSMLLICIMPAVVVVMTAGGTYSHSPFALFIYTPSLGLTGENITFNASDSYDPDGTISSYSWDFDTSNGIREDATGIEVTHQYATAGTYTVTLTVTSTTGTDTVTKDVVVKAPPIASFTYSSVSATETSFTDTSTDPDGGTIIGWYWEFGDGLTSIEQNPTHVFEQGEADYTVTLVVMDNDILVNETTMTVHVGSGPVNSPPNAAFSYSITPLGNDTFQVQFNSTSMDSDGDIIGWLWEFGDGILSLLENVTHNYTAGGTYTVNLTVTDDDGATDSVSQNISVGTTPSTHSGNGGKTHQYSSSTGEVTSSVNTTSPDEKSEPTSTAVAAPSATPTTTQTTPISTIGRSSSPTPPGFEAAFAVIGLITVAYLVLRRRV